MKIFKRIFVMFLLIFSSQQILANNTNFNKKNDVFIQKIKNDIATDTITLIREYEEFTGLRYENSSNIGDFLKLAEAEAKLKLHPIIDKSIYALYGLKSYKEIEKIIENIDKYKYKYQTVDEYIAELDKTIKKIKPRNMEEIKQINEIKNFINFSKKFLKIGKLEARIAENFKILKANGAL